MREKCERRNTAAYLTQAGDRDNSESAMLVRKHAFATLCASVLVSLGLASGAIASPPTPEKPAPPKTESKAPPAGGPAATAKAADAAKPQEKRKTGKGGTAPVGGPAAEKGETSKRPSAPPATKRPSKGPTTTPAHSTAHGSAKKPKTNPPGKRAANTRTSRKPPEKRPVRQDPPLPRLPGTEPGKPDERARTSIVGKRVDASLADPRESPELVKLREIDNLLFPRSRVGASSPVAADRAQPNVDASGLPLPRGGRPASSDERRGPASEEPELAWIANLEKPDFPVRLDPAVVRYLTYYKDNPRGRSLIAAWVKKSGRYGASIRKVLDQFGLPRDLLWLALVESGFDPTIHSHAGAAGLWQFVPSTGRIYGLTVTRRVDERLDPERSTLAAAKHLSDLHARFGSWELAFAAYNMGYGGLLSAIRKFNTNDYWELRRLEAGIPYETALYVPKIASIAIATRNCKVFGCESIEPDDPEPFGDSGAEAVLIAPGVTLVEVSEAVGVRIEQLSALNPQILGARLPPVEQASDGRRGWTLYVPRGKADLARNLAPKPTPAHKLASYTVRWGEPTEHIAARFGTTAAHLEQLNDLEPGEAAKAGSSIFVPAQAKPKSDEAAAKEVAGAHGLGRTGKPLVIVPESLVEQTNLHRVFYQPVLGDSLDDVAKACAVDADDLRRWNHLDRHASLQEGMTLQLWLAPNARPSGVLLLEAGQVETMTVESPAFFEHFVGGLGRRRLEVTAEPDDTWSKLAARHGMSVGMLERVNHRGRRSKLKAGDKVVVYSKAALAPPPSPPATKTAATEADSSEDDAAPEAGQPTAHPERDASDDSGERGNDSDDAAGG